jgi:hypothetical protein
MAMDSFMALVFGILIVASVFIGTNYFIVDLNEQYSGTPLANATNQDSMNELNTTIENMNSMVNESTTNALQYTTSDNPFAAAFGYLLGVFDGIKLLLQGAFQMPHLFLSTVSVITSNLGIFYPVWFTPFIILSISIMGFIYIIYIFTKVK